MIDKFKEGDVVVLKSNVRQRMTIEKKNTDGTFLCVWQDAKGRKQSDNYAEILIKIWVDQSGVYHL